MTFHPKCKVKGLSSRHNNEKTSGILSSAERLFALFISFQLTCECAAALVKVSMSACDRVLAGFLEHCVGFHYQCQSLLNGAIPIFFLCQICHNDGCFDLKC